MIASLVDRDIDTHCTHAENAGDVVERDEYLHHVQGVGVRELDL